MENLTDCLHEKLKPYCLGNTQFWLAYSGGLDSRVLLQGVWEYFRSRAANGNKSASLNAIHINHGLQSQADDWQAHCQSICDDLGIPLTTVALRLDPNASNVEALAREGRYRAFESVMTESSVLLMAHHLDDQAETFLYRLMRGSGTQGLAGMPEKRALGSGELLRPLLAITRVELEQYAQHKQLQWIEDPSNTNQDYDRNFIRHQVLPLLQTRWPRASQQIAKSSGFCRTADNHIRILAEQDWQTLDCTLEKVGFSVSLAALNRLEHKLACLRYGFQALQVTLPNESQWYEILNQVIADDARDDSQALVRWGDGFCAGKFRGRMHVFVDSPPGGSVSAGSSLINVSSINASQCVLTLTPSSETQCCTLPWAPDWLLEVHAGGNLRVDSDVITVRPRVGGERSQPISRRHSQKLKKVLQESAIQPWLRVILPLVYGDEALIAVADYWIEKPHHTDDHNQGFRLRLINQHPWQLQLEQTWSSNAGQT